MTVPTQSNAVGGMCLALVMLLISASCSTQETAQTGSENVSTVEPEESAASALEPALLSLLGSQDGGVSAVIDRNGILEVATVGTADLAGRPITADTSFYFGSISKVFTATLVMQLVETGHVALDDPLGAHLPDVPVGADRTIRALLGHRSGIPDFTEHADWDRAVRADRERSWEPLEILGYVDEPETTVDPTFAYSNTNYVLLGMLIEELHETDLNSVLQTEIAGPLGLTRTVYAGRGVDAPPPLANPFFFNYPSAAAGDVSYESINSSAFATGDLASTPTELRRFLLALSSGDLVSPETFDAMTTSQAREGDEFFDGMTRRSVDYGLGIEHIDLDGGDPVWLGHGGSLPGYRSVMAVHPDTSDVVVIVTNNQLLDLARFARDFLNDN